MPNHLHQNFFRHALLLVLALSCNYLQAADVAKTQAIVTITEPWVRATNPGQSVGAAYMTLSSVQDVTLAKVESDLTDSVEIHSMTMQNGVMKMRMLESLPLVAGKPYKLAPGGFHMMLFDLKKPLNVGEQVSFVLHFKSKNNAEFKQNIKVMVKSSADEAANSNDHEHHQH
jgi:copper(I)-binding protein